MFLLLVLLFPSTAAAPPPLVFCFLPPHSSVPALHPMSLSQSPVFYEPRSNSPPSSTHSCTACTWGPPFPRSGLALRSSHTPDTQENRFSSRPFVFLSSDRNTHLNYPLTHSCILEQSMPDPIIAHCAQQDLSRTLSQYTEI